MKTCRSCKKEIDSEANVCPYCRGFQDFLKPSIYNPLVYILLGGILYGGFYYFSKSIVRNSMKRMTEHNSKKHEIQILSHRLKKNGKSVRVMGELVNNAEDSWGTISLVAIFYDEKNESLVTGTGLIRRTLAPGEKTAFQINIGCSEDEGHESIRGYTSYEVEVDDATIDQITLKQLEN